MKGIVVIQLVSGVNSFLNILSILLIIYALMTWFMRPDNPVYVFLARIADVVLMPFRPISAWIIEKLGLRVEISVVLALISIRLIQNLLWQLVY